MKVKICLLLAVLAVLLASSPAKSGARQKVMVGSPVPPNQQISMDGIDHSPWNWLLQKYVNEAGQVDYKTWKGNTADREQLHRYLNSLSRASNSANATREARLAFWINAYNAVTVEGILREYPTSSIKNHTAKLVGYNIWKDLLLHVGDTKISLNDIEHEVLRKMGEPRIHFAIVCASHSCPRLLNQAYTAEHLADQLTLNTRVFFANPENFRYDANRSQVQLSSIMSWFAGDFGPDQASQLKSIAPYLPSRDAYDAAIKNTVRVSYLDYNWDLNEQKYIR